MAEVRRAVAEGYAALEAFNSSARSKGREILKWCARNNRPGLARLFEQPHHSFASIDRNRPLAVVATTAARFQQPLCIARPF
jgi:predicted nucleotide-binding protein (sugar kinase/HSP70/actin superfamily)